MTSKLEASTGSKLLSNKIQIMLADLNKDFANMDTMTQEGVINSFNEVVHKFYSSMEKPLFAYREFRQGKIPDIKEMNKTFKSAEVDIKTIYQELASIREQLTTNFNSLSGLVQKIKSDISMANSELVDYQIQNTNRIQPTFCDYFYDLTKIETDDDAYDKDKMFIDTSNNRSIFPLNGEAEKLKIKKVQIGENSIGTSGNNQEIDTVVRDNLQLLVDDNMDTWFEFEQVSKDKITTPTILNLKLEFEKEKIFNLLEIATVGYPTGTAPAITAIRGSVDGSIYFDLFPYYTGKMDLDSFGNRIIQLGANSSNPSDGNMLMFSPKKVKYLSVKFIEDSSYFIKTSSGIKHRCAIGIKEIKAKSQKYKNEGQLISTEYISDAGSEISKISLITEENFPINYEITAGYFISPDGGKTWEEIGATQKISDIPEVLNYNVDFLDGSKSTDLPVTSVKFKGDFKIKKSDSTLSSGSTYTENKKTEFQNISTSSSSLTLEKEPVGSVELFEIGYGSVGTGPTYKIPMNKIQELDNKIVASLPLNIFDYESLDVDSEEIYSDGILWSRVEDLADYTSSDLVYQFDYRNNLITFYLKDDNDIRHGKKPTNGIYFRLKREAVLFQKGDEVLSVLSQYSTDGIPEHISIYQVLEEALTTNIRLRNCATIHRLGIHEIKSVTVSSDINGRLTTEKKYLDGVMELTADGEYSIDYSKGILYTFSEVSSDEDVRISVNHQERRYISPTIDSGNITIPLEEYQTEEVSFSLNLAETTYVIDLGYRNIEKGSIQFSNIPDSIETEVKFEEIEDKFNDSSIDNPYSIDYRNGLIYVKNGASGSISGVMSRGDYYIEYRIANKVPSSQYEVKRSDKILNFTDSYIANSYVQAINESNESSSFYRIEYKYAEEVEESSGEMLQYTTPILNSYKITTVTKDQLI